jgi:hypothetical protein
MDTEIEICSKRVYSPSPMRYGLLHAVIIYQKATLFKSSDAPDSELKQLSAVCKN